MCLLLLPDMCTSGTCVANTTCHCVVSVCGECVCVCSYACVAMPNGSCSQVYQVALLHSMEDKFCCGRCSLDYHNNYDDCGWRTGLSFPVPVRVHVAASVL